MLLCSYVDPQPGCGMQPVACRGVAQQARDRQPTVSGCVTWHLGIGLGFGFKLRSAIAGRPAVGAGLGTMPAAVGRYICTCTAGWLMGGRGCFVFRQRKAPGTMELSRETGV